MNLADPELELLDPTPNVHLLFMQFDQTFFWSKLASRAVVKWSKRMYSCAGVCAYEGRGGLCNISLSEPLLKLRPRKDLLETLLHEMIHAFLFVTNRDQDRDGHGPTFQAHMHRINKAAGLNISIYHDFHDEVKLYQTHWWRCNGPCQYQKPYYGIVRRSTNRAPGPSDFWWSDHQRKCGGTYIKFKEPEKTVKKTEAAKSKGDITKYVTSTKTTAPPVGEPKIIQAPKTSKPVLTKSNSVCTSQKGVFTIKEPVQKQLPVFTGKGNTLAGTRVRSNSVDVSAAVRNVWANKRISSTGPSSVHEAVRNSWASRQPSTIASTSKDTISNKQVQNPPSKNVTGQVNHVNKSNLTPKATKHKSDSIHASTPPAKVTKIDDYFKSTAASILKDIYGGNIGVAESNDSKLIAIHDTGFIYDEVKVDCPICKLKINETLINKHLDECLNKDIISKICNGNENVVQSNVVHMPSIKTESTVNIAPNVEEKKTISKVSQPVLKEIVNNLPQIPPFRGNLENSEVSINYTMMKKDLDRSLTTSRGTFRDSDRHDVRNVAPDSLNDKEEINKIKILRLEFDPNDVAVVNSVVKKIHFDNFLKKSDNFIIPKEEKDLDCGFLPSFIDEDARRIELPPVKLEPGVNVITALTEQKCPCCGSKITKTIDEHLDECLAFFGNNDTKPAEGASTSFGEHAIVIEDDDDVLDESQLLNATGTKLPCPCCFKMVEHDDMNGHLDSCLS